MPNSPQRDLRGKHPIDMFPFFVSIDNTGSLFDGTGSLLTYLEVSTSYAKSSSYEIVYETSSSFADWAASSSVAISSSFASASISSSYSVSGSAALYSVSSSFSTFAPSSSQSTTSSFISASNVIGGLTQEIYFLSESFATMSFFNGILTVVI